MKRPASDNRGQIPGVTGVILAGGQSTRMGSNKALLPFRGVLFIEAIYRQLESLFDEVLLVTNTPEQYSFLPCRTVPDCYASLGPLAGIHAGLQASRQPCCCAFGCDMPYISEWVIRLLANHADAADVVIPRSAGGLEPLHALYGKGCLPAMEAVLSSGRKRIVSFFDQVTVREIPPESLTGFDPDFSAFWNVNTPEDYYRLRAQEQQAGQCATALRRAA